MRIRLKKGVALFGTIAGAAIATILIVYNVNQDNAVYVSDVDEAGILDLSGLFEGDQPDESTQPVVVAGSSGAEAAAAAGLLGGDLGDNSEESADTGKTEVPVSSETDSDNEKASGAMPDGSGDDYRGDTVSVAGGEAVSEESAFSDETEPAYRTESQTYVEAVPQTRTETVVDKRYVIVETPVTVTEQVLVETEVKGDFHSQSDSASAAELNTGRRVEEAAAIQNLINENLSAAANGSGESDYITGDMVDRDHGYDVGDVVVFE